MAILEILLTILVVSLLTTCAEATRRLFFHPLSHIPGPRLAAVTWWYEFYFDVIRHGKYIFKIQELHHQYGPIIRVTPDEIHINDVGFLDTIYAPATISPRNKYAYQLRSLRVPGGVGVTISHDLHKKRRDALAPFFNKRNVVLHEHLIREKLDQLLHLVYQHAVSKQPLNLSDAFYAFTNDIVNNFLFAHQTDTFAEEGLAATIRLNTHQLMRGVHLNKHFPLIPDMLESLPRFLGRNIMPPEVLELLALFDRVRGELTSISKSRLSTGLINDTQKPMSTKSTKESVFHSLLSNPDLPPSEKALPRLEREGALLVLAGSESPAKSLSTTLYYILSNHSILLKLRAELDTVPEDASWTQLEKLPYLSAVLEEGHRLSFDVTARTARRSPGSIIYTPSSHVSSSPKDKNKSYRIPAGTPMSTSVLTAHTADSVFPSPHIFDPDRWLGENGKSLLRFQMAFGKGSRKCLGIELARAEVFLATAAVVRGFEMELWDTEEGDVACVHDYHISMPELRSEGVKVMVRVRGGEER